MMSETDRADSPPPETSGTGPLLGEMPTVEAAGKSYRMRRLRPVQDHPRLSHILSLARASGINLGEGWAKGDIIEPLCGLVLLAIEKAPQDFYGLLASMLGVSVSDLDDENVFPPESLSAAYMGFMGHPDVLAFFGFAAAPQIARQAPPSSIGPSSDSSI